jgi:hypothetical protein
MKAESWKSGSGKNNLGDWRWQMEVGREFPERKLRALTPKPWHNSWERWRLAGEF